MIKTDGTSEKRRFCKGLDNVARLASLIEDLNWLRDAPELQEMIESNDSGVLGDFSDLVSRASAILRTMVNEEADSQAPLAMFAAPLKTATLKSMNFTKSGTSNNETDQTKIQHLHDTSVNLGAVCATQKISQGGLEKRFDLLADTLADVLCRVENIEEQPLPLPLFGQPRAISKTDDGGECHSNIEF
jgi:hypothetical protein